jgi:hypothetical protein
MSKVRALSFDLTGQTPSEDELARRLAAAGRRTGLVGDLDGRLVEPAPVPSQASRVIAWADERPID